MGVWVLISESWYKAASISRETSGIHDEDGQHAASYGLNQGKTVEEAGPDGQTRRVRILPVF